MKRWKSNKLNYGIMILIDGWQLA